MDIRAVREIIQCRPMTSLPLMPNFMRGVINLRGAVVPVIDLNARFGRPAATLCKKSCIVIFDTLRGNERIELGLLVDAVSEVIKIAPDAIDPPPRLRQRRAARLHPRHRQGGRALRDPARTGPGARCPGDGRTLRDGPGSPH